MLQFDDFKKCYGEILYRWGLRDKRADVLKFASCPPEPHRGIGGSTSHHTLHTSPSGTTAAAFTLIGLSGRFQHQSRNKYLKAAIFFKVYFVLDNNMKNINKDNVNDNDNDDNIVGIGSNNRKY